MDFMSIILVSVVGLLCMCCFLFGAKLGQTVARGERIETPTINPIEVYRKHEERKEAQQEQERVDIILQNIENYDGTAYRQKDVPGR